MILFTLSFRIVFDVSHAKMTKKRVSPRETKMICFLHKHMTGDMRATRLVPIEKFHKRREKRNESRYFPFFVTIDGRLQLVTVDHDVCVLRAVSFSIFLSSSCAIHRNLLTTVGEYVLENELPKLYIMFVLDQGIQSTTLVFE